MALNIRALALTSVIAGSTFFALPAAAAQLPAPSLAVPSARFDHSQFDPAATTADWRCRGWGCGYGHRRGYRRNRVDAGDVLIGAAIIGGIAAIASSANRRQRDRDVVIVERDSRDGGYNPRYNTRGDETRRTNNRVSPRGSGATGLDNAVNQCLTRIERDVRVDSVDNVERTGAGWLVSGALFNGSGFQCRIGNSGRIEGIDYGGGFSNAPAAGYGDRSDGGRAGQWADQRYADARLAMGGPARPDLAFPQAPAPRSAERLPAYPGGPIPGEDIPETIDGDL